MMNGAMRRRDLMAAAAAAAAFPARASQAPLRFLAVGDFGRDGRFSQREVAQRMAAFAAAAPCDFVLALGDNFYESGVVSADDPRWRTSFEAVYDGPGLQVPWYAVLGNHDYGGEPDAQIAYTRRSSRWRMPARYYAQTMRSADGATLELVMLDTTALCETRRDDPEWGPGWKSLSEPRRLAQLLWLEKTLAASSADQRIVVGHHPIFSGGEHGDTEALKRDVLPLLKRYRVSAYLNGHEHDLQVIARDGVHFICSGAGSKIRPTTSVEGTILARSVPGFCAFEFDHAGLAVAVIDVAGKMLLRRTIPA
jgi:tartrate-resistant acid phosphatase type 5